MGPLGTTWDHMGPLGATWNHLGHFLKWITNIGRRRAVYREFLYNLGPWGPRGPQSQILFLNCLFKGPEWFHDLPGPTGINFALTNPQNGGLTISFLGFHKQSGFLFSEPDLLIRKQIKYLDPCHPLRNTLLCRHIKCSARFMSPKKHFFVFCSETRRIRAKSGLCLFLESFRKCSEVFKCLFF